MKTKPISELSFAECCEALNLKSESVEYPLSLQGLAEVDRLILDRLNTLLAEQKADYESCTTIAELNAFAKRYPNTCYAAKAKQRAEKLKKRNRIFGLSALGIVLIVVLSIVLNNVIAEQNRREQERIEQEAVLSGNGRNGIYKVGDYYDQNGTQGVVFWVDSSGKHGKIVSPYGCSIRWSSYYASDARTGATCANDGAYNMRAIQAQPNWSENYPAAMWCADLGSGWYLPAKEELYQISRVMEKLNKTLSRKNRTTIGGRYWSSSEHNPYYANTVLMVGAGELDPDPKHDYNNVRAVSAF